MAWYDNPITNGFSAVAIPGNWDTPHYGIDIGLPMDTPITDLLPGTVVKSDYAPWGGEVFVKLANGLEEYFYHLDQLAVSVGQTVAPGQLIGLSGGQNSGGAHPISTLYSDGPHLHFGITNGQVVAGPAGQQYAGIDPTSIITAAKNGTLAGIGTGGVSDVINQAASAIGGSVIDLSGVNSFLTKIESTDLWVRVGLVLAGVVVLILGLGLFFKDSSS